MFGPLELVLCQGAQLYVEIHQRSCCTSLFLADHQGPPCILGHLRLAHHLDALQWASQPLYGEAWGQCPVPIPVAPCLHPTIRKPILSHQQSLSPMRAHPINLIPAVQKNQLLVWAPLHLSACDVPPVESVVAALPSSVGVALILFIVSPSAHATPSLFLPFSSYLSTFAQFTFRVAASYVE